MFDKSIFILKKCVADAKAFSYYATVSTQGFFLIYHILLLALSHGTPWVQGSLLFLTSLAFAFLLLTESPKGAKNVFFKRWTRIFVRYAKYCVHIVAISLMLYSLYSHPAKASAFALILLVFAILAFLIQIIAEIVCFLFRRYFEELLAAVLSDTELLRAVIDKMQDGAMALKSVKDDIVSLPGRAAEKMGALSEGIKKKLSLLKKKKTADSPLLLEGEFAEEADKETADKT